MAAPFVSGTAALLLQLQPTWTAADVRTAIEGTALDVGPAGKDNDWGAGILDGYEAVALAAGGIGETTSPAYQRFTDSVANNGTWTTTFVLGPDDLDAPIAATITLNGSATCVLPWFDNQCLAWDWRPDLEAELIGPSGFVIADSTCAADDECSSGRQETLHFTPVANGTYTIRISPAAGSPNNGQGGSFAIDLFTGPAGTSPPPPAPSVHVGDLDGSSKLVTGGWRAFAVVRVHDGDHALVEGAVVTGTWSGGTSATCTTDALGKCRTGRKFAKRKLSATFTVTDVSSAVGAYEHADNHDPDGDSNGTKITVLKP
jgi:serine protease AprX